MHPVTGWIIPALVGAATGVLSGFGVGGGTLLLVYLTAVAGVDQHLAQGINLLYFLPAGLLALPAHVRNGYVEKKALLPCMRGPVRLGGHGAGYQPAAEAVWGIFDPYRSAGTAGAGNGKKRTGRMTRSGEEADPLALSNSHRAATCGGEKRMV